MARYIDAEKLDTRTRGNNSQRTMWREIKWIVDNAPTADVVPRSEVENLQDELDLYGFVYGVTPDKQKVIGKVRSEVAREIFEEIEEMLTEYPDDFFAKFPYMTHDALHIRLAKLKKKYMDATDTNVGIKSEWISVKDRLPECESGAETGALLFRLWTGTVIAGYFGRGGIWRDKYFRHYWDDKEGWDASDVTHWMPLPEPPKD